MTKGEIEERIPEAKDLNQDQMNQAAERAKNRIEEFQNMDEVDRQEEIVHICVEMEYLREVKNFQKEVIQKKAKND